MIGKVNRLLAGMVCVSMMAPHFVLAQTVKPFVAAPAKTDLLPEEDRVWTMSDDLDRQIRRSGSVLDIPAVNRYLQQIMDRLYPELIGVLRVRAIDDPAVNAFCMANGSVYIHLGMLARIENESQLATVLAHEGAHFVHRHSYQAMQSAQSGSAFVLTTSILFGGIGALLGGLTGASSIAGFSRDLEREADRIGFERLVRAGYDARESPKVFEILAAVSKVEDKAPPYLFASHPRLQERIDSFREIGQKLAPTTAPILVDETAFQNLIIPLRETWLKREIGSARYKHVIYWLTLDDAAHSWPKHYQFYLGEAYRLRNEKNDPELAREAYRKATENAPDYSASYRALGMSLYKNKDPESMAVLKKYLALAPEAGDRLFVEQLLESKQ